MSEENDNIAPTQEYAWVQVCREVWAALVVVDHEGKGVPMESSEQDRPMESRGHVGGVKLDRAGDQNAGVINILHVVMVLVIVLLIVGYIVDKA